MSGERITRLFELGAEPERRSWVERYLNFMEERGTPVAHLPIVGKKPLDLWKFYTAVREIGGLAMVNRWGSFCCQEANRSAQGSLVLLDSQNMKKVPEVEVGFTSTALQKKQRRDLAGRLEGRGILT